MVVDIQGMDFAVTHGLAGHVRRRLGFVLARHGQHIRRVVVRVGDENGPRGGVDKYCRIHVHLLDAPAALVKEVGANLYAAIDGAADRIGRVVVKHVDRGRAFRGALARRRVLLAARHGAGQDGLAYGPAT